MKKISLALLVLTAIGLLAWLANFFSSGTINITSDDKNNTITLQKVNASGSFTKIGAGSLSATVKHGQYIATVQNGSKTDIQVINFKEGHKTFHYFIALNKLLSLRTVSNQNAQDLIASKNELIYLDNQSDILYKITGQRSPSVLGTVQQFRDVRWANMSFGVGQDDKGRLFTINGKSSEPLPVPFSYDSKNVSFDVSPDEKIYASHGPNVYAKSRGGQFKKIYVASSQKPTLAAGTAGVAVSDSRYGQNPSGASKSLTAIISTSGKKYKQGLEAERLAWSPNGQYLVTVNQVSPVIYDSRFKKVAVLPTTYVVGPFTWLSGSVLLFTSNNQVWMYDISHQNTRLLTSTPLGESINGIYPGTGKFYVTSYDSIYNTYAIKQISLAE